MAYDKASPYALTGYTENYLDFLEIRSVPTPANDVLYTIEAVFHQRPDLAAKHIYGNHKLWWVFAQRNMDILIDPVFDFTAGTKIYLLNGPALRNVLGL